MSRLLEAVAPARLGTGFRWLLWLVVDQQHRRRHRARGRPAAGRVADPRPVPGRARGAAAVAAVAGLRPVRRRAGRPARPPADRRRRRTCCGRSCWRCWPSTIVTGAVTHRGGAGARCSCSAPPRSSPTPPRSTLLPMVVAQARPRDRQRPAHGRVHHAQPARRAADRRGAVRPGMALPVRDPGGLRGARARCWCPGCAPRHVPRAGGAPSHVRQDIREGFRWTWGTTPPVRTLALDDRHLQRHLRARPGRCWCSTRSSGSGWARSGFGLLTTRRRRRRPGRHRGVRLARAPRQPRRRSCGSG